MTALDTVKALDLIAKPRRVAMCGRCDEPLVMTFVWHGAEFYCLDCGAHLGFLDPTPADETPELLERIEARRLEFADLAAGILVDGRQPEATVPQREADQAARARLAARIRKVPA